LVAHSLLLSIPTMEVFVNACFLFISLLGLTEVCSLQSIACIVVDVLFVVLLILLVGYCSIQLDVEGRSQSSFSGSPIPSVISFPSLAPSWGSILPSPHHLFPLIMSSLPIVRELGITIIIIIIIIGVA